MVDVDRFVVRNTLGHDHRSLKTDGYYCGLQLGWLPEAKASILGTLGELLQSSNEEAYAALSAEDVQQTTSLLSRGDFWLEQNHEACSVMCLSANWVVGVDLLMAGSEGTIVKEGMINGLSATWVDCVIHGKNPDTMEPEDFTTHYLLLYDPDKLCVVVLWGDKIEVCERSCNLCSISAGAEVPPGTFSFPGKYQPTNHFFYTERMYKPL